jgi:hypothetical protein
MSGQILSVTVTVIMFTLLTYFSCENAMSLDVDDMKIMKFSSGYIHFLTIATNVVFLILSECRLSFWQHWDLNSISFGSFVS